MNIIYHNKDNMSGKTSHQRVSMQHICKIIIIIIIGYISLPKKWGEFTFQFDFKMPQIDIRP